MNEVQFYAFAILALGGDDLPLSLSMPATPMLAIGGPAPSDWTLGGPG
jgi:hypothetical protein